MINWISRFLNFFKSNLLKEKMVSELEESNWGRNHGWYIEHQSGPIGELLHAQLIDQFWFRYQIKPYSGHEKKLHDFSHWAEMDFSFKNKHYNLYSKSAIPSPHNERPPYLENHHGIYFIKMRALHLDQSDFPNLS